MKRVFNLVDTAFAGGYSLTAAKVPTHLVWDRSFSNPDIPTFYTNEKIFEAEAGKENYAVIIEPRSLFEFVYMNAPQVMDRFKYVFTHDSELLRQFPDKCKLIPGGGVWIGGQQGGGEVRLYPKTKLVSIVSSTKSMCQLHLFRLQLALALKYFGDVDVYIASPGNYVAIIDTLSDYMYSIVVENHMDDYFFTEKVLNCFATGTVPIYHGARCLAEFFDQDGIIPFNGWADLVKILPTLSAQDYTQRLKAIQRNLERCTDFDNHEDYIVAKYGDILPSYPAT